MKNGRFMGLDVHAKTIAVAVAEPDGEVRALGVIPNRPESIRKLVNKLAPAAELRACYEEVVAPTLVPVRAGDRVKTGPARRDQVGAELPGGRSDAGLGTGRRT